MARRVVVVALATAALTAGCRDKEAERRAAAAAAAAAAPPPDHLAPGELPEGKQKAFALPLPRDVQIIRQFPGVVLAQSTVARPEQVANFFRTRVRDGTVSAGAAETKFLSVHASAEPSRDLTIEIRPGTPGVALCEVLVRDVTPPPTAPGLTEEERRKRAGLTPNGKVLDPKHLE